MGTYVIVGRPVGGIALNGLEYLLDDDTENEPLRFNSVDEAKKYLDTYGVSSEEIEDLVFERCLTNEDEGTLLDHLEVLGVPEHAQAMAAYLTTVLDSTSYGTMIKTKDFGELWQDYYKNVIVGGMTCSAKVEYEILKPEDYIHAGDEIFVSNWHSGGEGGHWEQAPYTPDDRSYPVGDNLVRRVKDIK